MYFECRLTGGQIFWVMSYSNNSHPSIFVLIDRSEVVTAKNSTGMYS